MSLTDTSQFSLPLQPTVTCCSIPRQLVLERIDRWNFNAFTLDTVTGGRSQLLLHTGHRLHVTGHLHTGDRSYCTQVFGHGSQVTHHSSQVRGHCSRVTVVRPQVTRVTVVIATSRESQATCRRYLRP